MASTTLNQVQSNGVRGFLGAIQDLALSFKNLLAGVFSVSTSARPAVGAPLTAFEEAEALRDYAQQFLQSDPAFAEDLFASADRHELASLKA